jgi:hypothetical protein
MQLTPRFRPSIAPMDRSAAALARIFVSLRELSWDQFLDEMRQYYGRSDIWWRRL